MKSLMLFLQVVLEELGTRCRTSTARDLKTVMRRVEDEGLSFLTITLAEFGKDLQKALADSSVKPSHFCGFHRKGGLPVFLRGFLANIFDSETGRLLDEPDIDSIFCLRQFTLMWQKIELPCTDNRIRKAFAGYIECEQELRDTNPFPSSHLRDEFRRIGVLLWANPLSRIDHLVYYEELVPAHGPGSTADRLLGNKKWNQKVWTERLEMIFPHLRYVVPGFSYTDRVEDMVLLEPGAEMPSRLVSVPKTLKTPRIIAIEPAHMQYMQQAIGIPLAKFLEEDGLSSKFLGFTDQEPNRILAREGSISGRLATLDLSEASDRVSNQHVRVLLANHPHLLEGIDACRTRKADVPGHGVKRLAKFASMGSALCFPIEAMVFVTLVFLGIQQGLRRPLTRRDIMSFSGQVRVYGDDIIVPVDYVHSVVSVLDNFGYRVNAGKSFWTGKFRESCGGDYYDGEDITVIRVRSLFPTRRKHAREVISTASLRNQLYKAGLWRSAGWLDNLLSGVIPWRVVEETSQALGRHSFVFPADLSGAEWDVDLQIPKVRVPVVSSRSPRDPLDDYGALLKCLTRRGGVVTADVGHLERAGRPHAVDIKLRWVCPW